MLGPENGKKKFVKSKWFCEFTKTNKTFRILEMAFVHFLKIPWNQISLCKAYKVTIKVVFTKYFSNGNNSFFFYTVLCETSLKKNSWNCLKLKRWNEKNYVKLQMCLISNVPHLLDNYTFFFFFFVKSFMYLFWNLSIWRKNMSHVKEILSLWVIFKQILVKHFCNIQSMLFQNWSCTLHYFHSFRFQ